MTDISIRPAAPGDLPLLTEIYNHYVVNTPVTIDIDPYTVEWRETWFSQFRSVGRHRLLVAEEGGSVLGYASTMRWRPEAAYDTTVKTPDYCHPQAIGEGIGSRLYGSLFEALEGVDIHALSPAIRFRIRRAPLCMNDLDSRPWEYSPQSAGNSVAIGI